MSLVLTACHDELLNPCIPTSTHTVQNQRFNQAMCIWVAKWNHATLPIPYVFMLRFPQVLVYGHGKIRKGRLKEEGALIDAARSEMAYIGHIFLIAYFIDSSVISTSHARLLSMSTESNFVDAAGVFHSTDQETSCCALCPAYRRAPCRTSRGAHG